MTEETIQVKISDYYYLKEAIDDLLEQKASISHVHDDRYYTETEINTKLNNYVTTSAIKNDLTTGGASNVLSAEQGKQLKAQIDSINNIEEILDDLLSETVVVSSKNPLIMTGDSTQLIARIYGDYGGNQTIKFYEKIDGGDDVLLSTSTTNNGVAYYDFTGEGTGERNFYAKWGSFQSEIYSVFDVIQYVDKSSDWYSQSGIVTQNSDGDWVIDGYHYIYNPSVPNNQYGWSGNLTLEFEVVSNTSGAVQFYNTSANFTQRLTVFGATTGSKVKLVFDGSKITPIVDGVTKTSYDFNPTGLFRIGFINSLTLKNILIY